MSAMLVPLHRCLSAAFVLCGVCSEDVRSQGQFGRSLRCFRGISCVLFWRRMHEACPARNAARPYNLLAAQTAHALNGSGLLPWRGTPQRTFEAQYSSLLAARGIDSSGLTYVGSLVGGFCSSAQCMVLC